MPNNYIDDVKINGVINDIHDKRLEDVSEVAVSGDYEDLLNKPTIPTALSELSSDSTHRLVTENDKTNWNAKGTYSKPSDGIPKSHLTVSVQSSLNKADSALQEEIYRGTVTQIKINNEEKNPDALGIVNLGTYLTEHQDISGKANITYVDEEIDKVEAKIPSLNGYATQQWVGQQGFASDSDVNAIEALIPEQATTSNQLADKAFVNSSVATGTGTYISKNGQPFDSVSELPKTTAIKTNDYAFVQGTDSEGNKYFDRYKATVSGSTVTWAKEYRLNNSNFTAVQWAAINSTITSEKVADITSNTNARHTHSNKSILDSITQAMLNQLSSVPNKMDKVTGGTTGNFTVLNSSGNVIDSGVGVAEANAFHVTDVINKYSTHNEIPTAKAIYDLLQKLDGGDWNLE